jgi:hypothetical protein
MSKRGRSILRGSGPYLCLYSPECVEGGFSDVCIALVQHQGGLQPMGPR